MARRREVGMPRVYISAGETSGDLHAGGLVSELLARSPDAEVFGMGGPRMEAAGCRITQSIEKMAVMGFAEVLWRLPYIRGVYKRTLKMLKERRPDVAVLVDYPGYHLPMARELKALGIPVVLYIAPQVWAWKPGRTKTVAEVATKLLVIFDFEVPIFREAGADVEWVGHPLLDEVDPDAPGGAARGALGLEGDRPLLALLPGTRRQVLKRLLPVFMETAREVQVLKPEVACAIGTPDGAPLPGEYADAHELAPPLETRDLLRDATACLLASGTVTLEAALLGCPGVVGYRMGRLNYFVGKRVVRCEHIALANIVLGARVYPELIQHDLLPASAAAEVLGLITDPSGREAVRARLRGVRAKLGRPGASGRAAEAVLGLVP
jgi:lipid-A-disaccharide synthase